MQIIDYAYKHGTVDRDGYVAIPEISRYKPSALQFIKLANLDITLSKPTAFLYVDGFTTSQSESGINDSQTGVAIPALKSGSSYCMHEWIYTFKNKENLVYSNIVSSTCASGVQAISEAARLLDSRVVQEVIVIGCERTTEDTLRLFKELNMSIKCGDGFFYLRLGHAQAEGTTIKNINWKYAYSKNPFYFSKETLDTLTPGYPIDYVKLHGTGTKSNSEAESGLATLGKVLTYKNTIGHTQGISSLLETCIVLDDDSVSGQILVAANGVGGFYGSFILIK